MLRRLTLALLLSVIAPPLHAQIPDTPTLTDSEVDQLRDSAYVPNERVLVFLKLLDTRNKAIQELYAHPRKPGREQDTHDLMQQFTALAEELNDNLDDYGPRHRDIRKALPKLLEATERWSSNLKSPPDDTAYNISRRLALEAVQDLREETTKLIDEQRTWFAAHPPPKEDKNKSGVIDIPR